MTTEHQNPDHTPEDAEIVEGDEPQHAPPPVTLNRDILQRAKTGSIPGVSRSQERQVTQPKISDVSSQATGVGGTARFLAKIRNVVANNHKLSAAEREIFARRCELAVAVQASMDEAAAREVYGAAQEMSAKVVMNLNAALLDEIRGRMQKAEDECEEDLQRIESRPVPEPLKDEMKSVALKRYFQATETDSRIVQEAVERTDKFGQKPV